MPDHSQQYAKTSAPRQQPDTLTGNPADTTGNNPGDATPESLESNVSRASEGEQVQADQTINRDPMVSNENPAQPGNVGSASGAASGSVRDNYDDEDAWSYRDLQHEAKNRGLNAGGDRDELVAKLREADGSSGTTEEPVELSAGVEDPGNPPAEQDDVPRGDVDAQQVDNGGIQRTDAASDHASILQGLSDQRREQQLAAARAHTGRRAERDES